MEWLQDQEMICDNSIEQSAPPRAQWLKKHTRPGSFEILANALATTQETTTISLTMHAAHLMPES